MTHDEIKTYSVNYVFRYHFTTSWGSVEYEKGETTPRKFFQCLEKDIKEEVTKHIEEFVLKNQTYCHLEVEIIDYYEIPDQKGR